MGPVRRPAPTLSNASDVSSAQNSTGISARPQRKRLVAPVEDDPIKSAMRTVTEHLKAMEDTANLHHKEVLARVKQLSQHQPNQEAARAPATPAPKVAFDEVFNWVSQDTIRKFQAKQFTIEDFLKLRKPCSVVCPRPLKRSRIVLGENGNLEVEEDPSDVAHFMKAVPSLGALLQLWSTYTAMAVFYSDEPKDLSLALNKIAHELAELEAVYTWENVCSYFFALCLKRFNHANAKKWAEWDFFTHHTYLWDRR